MHKVLTRKVKQNKVQKPVQNKVLNNTCAATLAFLMLNKHSKIDSSILLPSVGLKAFGKLFVLEKICIAAW